MKNLSGPVISYLNSNQEYVMAEIITFTLNNGTVLRYALYDEDIKFLGNTFSSNSPPINRGKISTSIGVQVDTLELSIYPRTTDLVGSLTFLQAVAQGLFDGATCKLERVFMPSYPTVLGGYIVFFGNVAECNIGRTSIQMSVNTPLQLLNIQIPRNLYQPACIWTLYEPNTCKAVKASFTDSGTVSSATKSVINFSSARAAGYYTLGFVKFTSGALNGLSYTVQKDTTGVLNVIPPMLRAPANGDTFTATAGCDHTQSTCNSKFGNLINFRGYPYTPVPETTL